MSLLPLRNVLSFQCSSLVTRQKKFLSFITKLKIYNRSHYFLKYAFWFLQHARRMSHTNLVKASAHRRVSVGSIGTLATRLKTMSLYLGSFGKESYCSTLSSYYPVDNSECWPALTYNLISSKAHFLEASQSRKKRLYVCDKH